MTRLLRLLALRHLGRHPLRAALVVVGVAAGTALAVGVLVVRASVERSVTDFGRQLSGPTELRVVGAVRRGGLEPAVVDAVAGTEGVAAAVPLVQAVTVVERPVADGARDRTPEEQAVLVLGVDCRAEALVGARGCRDDRLAAAGDSPLAVSRGVDRAGALRTATGTVPLTGAAGVPPLPGAERLAGVSDGRVVVFSLATAQRLFGRGDRVDMVYVDPERGAAVGALRQRLAAVVGEQNGVLDASEGPPEVRQALADMLPLFTLMALFALGTGAMLAQGTTALAVEERRRDLAVVGALGGTPGTLAATVLGEAAVLGLLGGVLGAAGGTLVASPIVASLSTYAQRVAGVPLTVHTTAGSLAAGVAVGLVVAVLSAWGPVRRALRADVAAELSGRERRAEAAVRGVSFRRLVVWLALLLVGLVLAWLGSRRGGLERWQVPAGALGFALVAVAAVLGGTGVATLALRPCVRAVRRRAAGRLAVANLLREPRRTGVMVAAVGSAAGVAFVTAGYARGVEVTFLETATENMNGVQVSSVAPGANVNLDTGLPPDLLEELRGLPGVDRIEAGATVLAASGGDDLVAVSAYQRPWDVESGEALRGRLDRRRFEAGEALVNAALARDRGLRPGDRLALPTPTGMVAVPVQAVVEGGGATGAAVQIPWAFHRRLYGPQPARAVVVRPEPGTSLPELARTIRRAELAPWVRVRTPTAAADAAAGNVSAQLAPFRTLQRGLLGVAFVAVLSTLLLVGVQRRRELGLLGALGMEPTALARMVVAEAAAVGLVAAALGVVGGAVVLGAVVLVGPLLVGFPVPFAPALGSYAGGAALAVAVALAAALWPSYRAARTDPIVALRDE